MTESKQLLKRYAPEFSFDRMLDGELWQSLTPIAGGDMNPTQFTRVRIASRSGARVFGVLRAMARGGIQVLTTIPVPVHSPIEITLEGCQPAMGEAFYSIKRSSVFLVGIVLSSRQKPNCAVGSRATIRDLDAPLATCLGNILEVENTRLSVLCKTAFPPGAWVRLESSGCILFGVVRYVVATSTAGHCVGVHLEAIFRADSRPGAAIPETHILRSFPKLEPWTLMDRESPLQGEIL